MKFIRNSIVFTLFIFAIIWLAYTFFLPKMAADSIASGSISPFIPEKYQPAIEQVQTNIDEKLEGLPAFLDRHELTYDDILRITEETTADELMPLINEILANPDENASQIFERVVVHLGHKVRDPMAFRETFINRFDREKFEKGVTYLRNSELPLDVSIEFGRKVFIEILKQREEEIKLELQKIQSAQ